MTSAEDQPKKTSDFSIDHILNKAGPSPVPPANSYVLNCVKFNECGSPTIPFTWLQCTRYCPPKVPRKREGPQKRQLGRHPRIPFTSHQLAVLEERFRQSPYLSSEEVTKLSRILQLADIRVKIWFQNRRARERRERQQQTEQISPVNAPKLELSGSSGSELSLCSTSVQSSPTFKNSLLFRYPIKDEELE